MHAQADLLCPGLGPTVGTEVTPGIRKRLICLAPIDVLKDAAVAGAEDEALNASHCAQEVLCAVHVDGLEPLPVSLEGCPRRIVEAGSDTLTELTESALI